MERVLEELIHVEPHLTHPNEVHDRSSPMIEPGYHLQPRDVSELLEDVKHGVPLAHVPESEVHDRSQPMIDSSVHVSRINKKDFLTEVQVKGTHSAAVHELKHKFMEEAREGGLPLHHVEHIHDTSGPKIPADAHVTKAP